MSLRLIPLAVAAVLSLRLFSNPVPVIPIEADPVLGITIVKAEAGAARRAGDAVASAVSASGKSVEWSHAYLNARERSEIVIATQWSSIEGAEAAALALDGKPAMKALDELGTTKSRRFFRRIRSHRYSDGPVGHVEAVIFRTKPGTTRESNAALFDGGEGGFSKGEGLLGHSLWLSPDGTWVHLLLWRSGDDYAKTAKAFMKVPGVLKWIRSLDYKRFTVTNGDVL